MMDLLAFWEENFPSLFSGLVVSLKVTGICLAIGLPMGLLLAIGVQSKSRAVRYLSLFIVEIGRGAPALVLLQLAYYGLPSAGLTLSSFAAASLALSWTTGAYTSEIIRAGLEAVPYGEREAAAAIGLSRIDTLRFVIVPQGLRVAAPALLGFSTLMLQASSLCFAVALPELTSRAYMVGTNTFQYMAAFCLAALLYASVCIPATIAVGFLERRLSHFSS